MIDFQELMNALKCYLCVPLVSTCELESWLNNPRLAFYGKSDDVYKRAVDTLQRQFSHYKYADIVKLINDTPNCVWYARHDAHYMSPSNSFNVCKSLLMFQYRTEEEVKNFLQRLYNICEKVIPKKNTMFISGKSNCGKSYFFDMVTGFYVNVGAVANFVRGQNFPLNDAVNKRILYWNEPSIMPSGYETLKMLSGGDPIPVTVKYASGAVISRTPLIMTSNNPHIFPKGSTWDTRVYREHWKPCDMLKEVIGYPTPRVLPMLFEHFNIEM